MWATFSWTVFRSGPVPAGSEGVLADLCEGQREGSREEEELG